MKIICILISLFLTATASASSWKWVKATSHIGGWEISEGVAEVEIEGDDFTAYLYWSDIPDREKYSLHGEIVDGKITVKETVHDSGYSGSTYTGKYEKKHLKRLLMLLEPNRLPYQMDGA